jgi:hypothetical protein
MFSPPIWTVAVASYDRVDTRTKTHPPPLAPASPKLPALMSTLTVPIAECEMLSSETTYDDEGEFILKRQRMCGR